MTNRAVAVVKVGGKTVDPVCEHNRTRATARVVAEISRGEHGVTPVRVCISYMNGEKSDLSFHVSHPLWSGTKFKPLHEKPAQTIVITGAGPQMDRACPEGKENGVRTYTSWYAMRTLKDTVFLGQAAQPLAEAIRETLPELAAQNGIAAISGAELFRGTPIQGKGAIGMPSEIGPIPDTRIIVASSVVSCMIDALIEERIEADGTTGLATLPIKGAPMNSNSDWIWKEVVMHYLNQGYEVHAYNIKLGTEVEQFAGNCITDDTNHTCVSGGMEVSAREMVRLQENGASIIMAGV